MSGELERMKRKDGVNRGLLKGIEMNGNVERRGGARVWCRGVSVYLVGYVVQEGIQVENQR